MDLNFVINSEHGHSIVKMINVPEVADYSKLLEIVNDDCTISLYKDKVEECDIDFVIPYISSVKTIEMYENDSILEDSTSSRVSLFLANLLKQIRQEFGIISSDEYEDVENVENDENDDNYNITELIELEKELDVYREIIKTTEEYGLTSEVVHSALIRMKNDNNLSPEECIRFAFFDWFQEEI